jgi:hypothetical protein
LRLLRDGKILDQKQIESPWAESEEIVKMLTAIVKTTAENTIKDPKLIYYGNPRSAR